MLPPERDQAAWGTARAGQGVQGLPVQHCSRCVLAHGAGGFVWGSLAGIRLSLKGEGSSQCLL